LSRLFDFQKLAILALAHWRRYICSVFAHAKNDIINNKE